MNSNCHALQHVQRPARGRVLRAWLLGAGAGIFLTRVGNAAPDQPAVRDLCLEFRVQNGTAPLRLNDRALEDAGRRQMSVTRMDFLVSELALQRADGTWMESRDWYALMSAGQGLHQGRATGVPLATYQALRFSIGVPPVINAGDPNQYEPGHALHPQTSGLHWGWQGGYIFMAMEGAWQQPDGKPGGWSFHLANNAMLTKVELPLTLDLARTGTVTLALDAARLTRSVDLLEDGTSTHSREGDSMAGKLQTALRGAWSVAGMTSDRFQAPVPAADATARPASHGTPFPIAFSARLPRVQLPADNQPTMEGVELGRRLFHEKALSADSSVSCASCHTQQAAFADPDKAVSTGIRGATGKRNAMPLFNLAWQKEFFWDGRAQGLRNQVLQPIVDPVEMGHPDAVAAAKAVSALPEYSALFERAFGDASVTKERLGLALEQYLHTLVSQDSRFDQAARGEVKLTPEEQRGLELFVTEHDPARGLRGADCFHCHSGNLFTNGQFASNGLAPAGGDRGRAAVTGLASDEQKFRVPSLRNVAVTGPWMHDGRFHSLEEVVAHYDHGVTRGPNLDPNIAKHPTEGLRLSAADQAALVAFLKTLTDQKFISPEKAPVTP